MTRAHATGLAAAVLSAAVLLVPNAASVAAAPTCQGQEATIVGWGAEVQGTDGNDVIVTTATGLAFVNGNAGDDLICIDGTLRGRIGPDRSEVTGGPGHDSLLVRTGADEDFLSVFGDIETLDVSLGGGLDTLRMYDTAGPGGTGVVDAGRQGGLLRLAFSDKVHVDLEDGTMLGGTARFGVQGFSRVIASGSRVVLDGDRRSNLLLAFGCRARVEGGRGDDVLLSRTAGPGCKSRGARILGQRGDDRLGGTSEDDVLLGGPGRDRANGHEGSDKCAAETEKACER